jgi:hypothetical protein
MPLKNLHPDLKNMLKDNITTNYLLTPQYFKKNYIVLEVKKITDGTIAKFEDVRTEVRKKLEDKISLDVKKKLLKKYLPEDKH